MSIDSVSPTPDLAKSLWKITKVVLDTLDFNEVTQKICDSLLSELGYLNLGYRIIVLSLYQEETKSLQRISLSQTSEAAAAVSASTVPFHDISIPITATDNYCVKAYLDQKEYSTHDWKDLLTPPLDPDAARHNQEASGIKASLVFPVIVHGKSVGTVIFSLIKEVEEISVSEMDLIRGFTEIIGVAVQNAKLYAELDQANRKLVSLDKAKDEFVSLASHELRTPMTAIKSYVWLVLNDKAGPIDAKAKQYLELVLNSTERLIHLVNDMLDISRIESGKTQLKPGPLDMPVLFTEILSEFSARAAEKQVALSIGPSDKIPTIMADKEKVMQVLENLVGNSLKFTDPNGQITLSTSVENNTLITRVKDTGKGIAPEEIARLFTKFERGSELSKLSEPGTGLGLYLCKQYVELHKGKIWAESELGKGSTFAFALPLQ